MTTLEIEIKQASSAQHDQLCQLARTSRYTSSFSNRLMFSSEDAYQKGWIRSAHLGWRSRAGSGELIGLTCVRHKTRTPVTELYFLVVKPDMRGRGVGEVLVRDLMAKSPGGRIELNVMCENARAVKFYRRLGFLIVSETMGGRAYRMAAEREQLL